MKSGILALILISVVLLSNIAFAEAGATNTNFTVTSSATSAPISTQIAIAQPTVATDLPSISTTQPIPVSEPTLKPQPVSAACEMVEKLFKEYYSLTDELMKAENSGDKVTAEKITNGIIALKQEIYKHKELCNAASGAAQSTTSTQITKMVIQPSQPPAAAGSCAEIAHWESKYAFYKNIYALSDDEIKKKGYSGKDEIERILNELSQGMEKIRAECTGKQTAGGVVPTTVATPSEITADSGESIRDYYKKAVESVTSTGNTDSQIKSLKELRKEIDSMIEKLIKSKDSISTDEVGDLVERIQIAPGEITADNVKVSTVGKQIKIDIDNNSLSVEPTEDKVIIRDKDLNVSAENVSIVNGVLNVGNAAVKITPTDVVNKLKMKVKVVELKEMNDTAVYKIKAIENRKLFGLFAIDMEKDITTDTANGNVVSENAPWWSVLTTV